MNSRVRQVFTTATWPASDESILPHTWRGWFSAALLLLLVIGEAGVVASVPGLRLLGLLTFTVLGLGSGPLLVWTDLGFVPLIGLSVPVSLCVLIVLGTIMATTGSWHPVLVLGVTDALAAALHLVVVARAVRRPPGRRIDS